MDELVVADVDAHVGGHCAVILEEHQVAGLQVAAGDRGAVAQLAGSAVRQLDARLGKHVHGKAGAVEAAGGCAAVDIGHAQILLGDGDDAAAGYGGRGRLSRCLGRCLCRGLVRCFSGRILGGLVRRAVQRRGRADQHILGRHIAADTVVGDGEPAAALDTGDGDDRAVGHGGQRGAAALGGGADVQHVRGDAARAVKAGGGVVAGDVLGGHIAPLAVKGDAVPIALLGGQLHHGTLVQGADDVIAGARAAAHAHAGAGDHAQGLKAGGDGNVLLGLRLLFLRRSGLYRRLGGEVAVVDHGVALRLAAGMGQHGRNAPQAGQQRRVGHGRAVGGEG